MNPGSGGKSETNRSAPRVVEMPRFRPFHAGGFPDCESNFFESGGRALTDTCSTTVPDIRRQMMVIATGRVEGGAGVMRGDVETQLAGVERLGLRESTNL